MNDIKKRIEEIKKEQGVISQKLNNLEIQKNQIISQSHILIAELNGLVGAIKELEKFLPIESKVKNVS